MTCLSRMTAFKSRRCVIPELRHLRRWLVLINLKASTHAQKTMVSHLNHFPLWGCEELFFSHVVFLRRSQTSLRVTTFLAYLQLFLVKDSRFPPAVPRYNSPWLVPLHSMLQLTEYDFIVSSSYCQRITSRWIYLQLTEGDSAIVCHVQDQTVIYHTQTKTYSTKHTSTQTHTRMESINHQSV